MARETNLIEMEAPEASEELRTAAEEAGAEITGWSPEDTKDFLTGGLTLGELEGITKEDQYEMAHGGFILLGEGKLERAKNIFEGLHALDPFDAYFLTALGSIEQQGDDLEKAEEYYSRAIEINPFSIAALAHRAEIRVLLGNLAEAAEDFARVAEQDPDGVEPAARRARAIATVVLSEMESHGSTLTS